MTTPKARRPRPEPPPAAATEPPLDQLLPAAMAITARGLAGFVWIDRSLRVTAAAGSLVDAVRPGLPLTAALPVFVGLETEIQALIEAPEAQLSIPSVGVAGLARATPRVDLTLVWQPAAAGYLLLVTPAGAHGELEMRLAAAVRARAIAEAEIAAQARVLARTNAELAAANSDLDAFAAIISHDLKAPLRGMRYALADAEAAIAEGAPQAALGHVRSGLALSRRMAAMLTGLLEYARIGRKSEAVEMIDTRALVEDIVASLRPAASQTLLVTGDWPTIATLAAPLDLVLRNLIDNAVKHHDRPDGRIVVSATTSEGWLRASVADDGPGIDPAWHGAIFEPFRQLAEAGEAKGAGIGLALVKRTVERYGGAVEVRSSPPRRRGARFEVRWPLVITT